MIFFRIGNRQLVASCRFELMLLNPQLGSESAQSRVGKGRVWLGRVGLGLDRAGVSNADSDRGFYRIFSNRQLEQKSVMLG